MIIAAYAVTDKTTPAKKHPDEFERDDYGKHLILEPTAYLSDVFSNE
jgi:hypothetical protein